MKYPNANTFAAWFLMLQTLAMGWVAATGRIVLELLGEIGRASCRERVS
jgi:hypothetical protein